MRLEIGYAGLATIASAISTVQVSTAGPVTWNVGGVLVPLVPSLVGVLSALLVRVIVITSPSARGRNLRSYNVAVTLLTALGAATYITDHQLGPGASFWAGTGCGAAGVGIIELARSSFLAALRNGISAMYQTMFPSRPDAADEPEQ